MKRASMILLSLCASWMACLFVNNEAIGEGVSGAGPVASISIGTNEIKWYPHSDLGVQQFVLKVSGPGSFFSQESFDTGSTPYFRLTGAGIDGQYTYELLGIPALLPELRDMLAEARKTGDDAVVIELQNSGRLPLEKLVQSGYFSVIEGHFVVDNSSEESDTSDTAIAQGAVAPLDVIHYDDLITTGSLCVGFDCADGESFGYCTQKLKENNLQLCFEDTSTGTFPANDWKIQINDTTSGGANYFTIWDTDGGRRPFTIEAGAPAHSLYVEDYGRVGLGTSTPAVELHMADGDSPTVRLDQDGSSGWAKQVWDIAGNEANFFVRDVTNGSQLSFRIQPGAPTNSITIKSDGKVGIGTWSPEKELHVEGSAVIKGSLELGSSRELKENIDALSADEALAALKDLRPVKYNYKKNINETVIGFIAEDVPELVATNSRKTLNPMDIVAMLTKVVQEQQKIIEKHENMAEQLNSSLQKQQKTIEHLSQKLDVHQK